MGAPGFNEEQLRTLEPSLQFFVKKCLKERDSMVVMEEETFSKNVVASEPSKQGQSDNVTVMREVAMPHIVDVWQNHNG